MLPRCSAAEFGFKVVACYHPLQAFRTATGVSFSELSRDDHLGSIELPCGQCIGCRMARASEWEMRVMHEASLHERNCFVTLTYAPGNLPPYGSLCYRDFQLFMKRLRKKRGGNVRFYMCGEYGELNRRPHYHACLFGVDFPDAKESGRSKSGMCFSESEELDALWTFGKCTVQELVRETAGYCARYIMKKALGEAAKSAYTYVDEFGEMHELEPEFSHMSLKPGIGADWLRLNYKEVYPSDFVIANGSKRPVPRYYDKMAKNLAVYEDVEYKRVKRGLEFVSEKSPERLAVREEVHLGRVSNLKRDLS